MATPQEIQHEMRTNIKIFAGLLALTLIVIAIRCSPFTAVHKLWIGIPVAGIELGLIIYYFRHLIARNLTIFILLMLTLIFAFSILFWPAWEDHYSIRNSRDVSI